jgi:hypothetical protein
VGFLYISLLLAYFILVHPTPSITLPYLFTSHPPTFQQLSVDILISSTFTDAIFHNITNTLSFSFPSPLLFYTPFPPISFADCTSVYDGFLAGMTDRAVTNSPEKSHPVKIIVS